MDYRQGHPKPCRGPRAVVRAACADYIASNQCSKREVHHEASEVGLGSLGECRLQVASCPTNRGVVSAAQPAAALTADSGAIPVPAATYETRCGWLNCEYPS